MGKADKIKFLEADEVARLMEGANLKTMTGLRNRCIMGLMYESGLRIGEVLALKPRDVVIEDRRIEVLRGKGNKPRTVYWRSQELSIHLERWKRIRPAGDYLFCTVRSAAGKGGKLLPESFRSTFRRYVASAGLDPHQVTPHTLRHTCATELMRRKESLRVIQEALGHSWLSTTQLYTHVVNEDVRRAMTVP